MQFNLEENDKGQFNDSRFDYNAYFLECKVVLCVKRAEAKADVNLII